MTNLQSIIITEVTLLIGLFFLGRSIAKGRQPGFGTSYSIRLNGKVMLFCLIIFFMIMIPLEEYVFGRI